MKNTKFFSLLLVCVLAALLLVGSVVEASKPQQAITNWQRATLQTATANTADWNTSGYDVDGYGSVTFQVTQDVTDTNDIVTYTVYSSLDTVACASVTNWAAAYDTVLVTTEGVQASRYISYTTYPTGTNPVTTTYTYADVAAVAGTASRVRVAQTFSITGDATEQHTFATNGAGCMRLSGALTSGRTVTTTIYIAPIDQY